MFAGFCISEYKRKEFLAGSILFKSEGKAVAFHVMKPCIGFIQGFFFGAPSMGAI